MELTFSKWEPGQDLTEYLNNCEKQIIDTLESDTHQCAPLFNTIESLLKVVIMENFTGPPTNNEASIGFLGNLGVPITKEQHKQITSNLMMDGEIVTPIIRRGHLLCIAVTCTEALYRKLVGDKQEGLATSDKIGLQTVLWRMRCCWVYQRMLTTRCNTLRMRLNQCFANLKGIKRNDVVDLLQLHLEIGNILDFYREVDLSNLIFQRAKDISGLQFKLTGKMGVRTQHQEFKVAQLVLDITQNALSSAEPEPPQDATTYGIKPKLIQSEDCHVLQLPSNRNLVFRDESEVSSSDNLCILHQAMVISLCLNVRNNNASHGLTNEEMRPYVERLLSMNNMPYPLWWMVLLTKSRLERQRAARVAERALLQAQELVDVYVDADNQGKQEGRYTHFYLAPFPSYYKLCRELARYYQSLGMAKTAESIAESVEDWEFVVECCQIQGNLKRAETITDQLLEKDPNDPVLWCCKAEAAESSEYFHKAWELSGHKLARAMRGLAKLHLKRKQYEESIKAFEKALALNPIYGGNWFQLGYCYQMTEKWEKAIQAYTRVVQLDMEDAQAWNNLATVYLKVKRLREALTAMTSACKLMDHSWNVKENHYLIAAELGDWNTCMNDLMALIQMRSHNYQINGDVLELVMDGLIKEVIKSELRMKEVQEQTSNEAQQPHQDQPTQENSDFMPNPTGDIELPDVSIPDTPQINITLPPEDQISLCANMRSRVEALITKMDATFVDNAAVYRAIASYHNKFENVEKELLFNLKEHRALTRATGWNLPMLEDILKPIEKAMTCVEKIQQDERLDKTTRVEATKQIDLMLHNTKSRCRKDDLDNTPPYTKLLEWDQVLTELRTKLQE